MAGAMLDADGLEIVTAGTHVVEGQPMSRRTRDALVSVGFTADGHRSHQLTERDLEEVAYIRRRHPEAAPRTATIKRLCRDLADGPAPLADRVRALGLAGLPIEAWEDVEDPAGGDDGVYVSCAEELAGLCAQLRPRLL
jgi:protein-tyrosine-phosphatase